MRIGMNVGGDVTGTPVAPIEIATQARAAEDAGFPAVWATHVARGTDTLPAMAVAGVQTRSVDLGIAVVPTYPRHPHALAQTAATVQSLCGGRFTLGIGVSHRPVIEGALGLDYASPAAHMREYLQVLGPLLATGEVSHRGRFYNVEANVQVVGASPVSVVVAALGPKMIEVAGTYSDGTVTWMAGARGIADIATALAKAAAAAGRPAPRIIAGIPVALCDDVDAGREAVLTTFARYDTLANYQGQYEREGSAGIVDQVVYGPEEVVLRRLTELRDAGATELWPVPFAVGADGAESIARTTAFLAALAPEI